MATSTTALTQADYRSVKAWSNSDISLVRQSAALIEWSRNAPSDGSSAVDLGTHLHCAVLEPNEFIKNYVTMPEYGSSAAGKRNAELFEQNMKGKIILDTKTYETVVNMRESILAHPVARKLLTSPGQSEVSIFGEIQGMKVKIRPDRKPDPAAFSGQRFIVDVKKTADIDKFLYSVRDFGYHRQAAMYTDVDKQLGEGEAIFVFVVVGEKRSIGRYPVRVWRLPDEVVEAGRAEYLEGLEMCREYEEFGCGLDIEMLDMRGIIR